MMLRIAASIALASIAFACPVEAADNAPAGQVQTDAESLALSRQIIAAIIPPDKREEVFGGVMRAMAKQMSGSMAERFSDPGLKAIMDHRMDAMPQRFMPILKKAYG